MFPPGARARPKHRQRRAAVFRSRDATATIVRHAPIAPRLDSEPIRPVSSGRTRRLVSVFSEASQALGVPAWAVPICLGILGVAKLFDGSMKPEAKAEIGEFLDHGDVSADTPTVINAVRTAFNATFDSRQFSWRCLYRTVLLSTFAVYAISLLIWSKHEKEIRANYPDLPPLPEMIARSVVGILIVALVLNWVSVGKTRLILSRMRDLRGVPAILALMVVDIILTYALVVALYWGPNLMLYGRGALCYTIRTYQPGTDCHFLLNPGGVVVGIVGVSASMLSRLWSQAGLLTPGNILNLGTGFAALLTSIWTVLIVAAMAILRLLSPLAQARRVLRWGWDLRASPVMALGWIVAVLVWVMALIYAIV